MVWHYATLDGNVPKNPGRVQFPIETDETKWDAVRPDRLLGVSDEIADRIRSVQLFLLDDPPDRALPDRAARPEQPRQAPQQRRGPTAAAADRSLDGMEFYSASAAARAGAPSVEIKADLLVDGIEILEVNVTEPLAKVTGGYQAGFVVTFDTGKGSASVVETLARLATSVRNALPVIYAGALPEPEAM
jgi:hypothetical protein